MQQRKPRRRAASALNPRRDSQARQPSIKEAPYHSKSSPTEETDEMSGRNLTKAKILVVHRIGFVRSGVLSLIAKGMQFAVCGETDEAPLARETARGRYWIEVVRRGRDTPHQGISKPESNRGNTGAFRTAGCVLGSTCLSGGSASLSEYRGCSRTAQGVRRNLSRPLVRRCERVAANPK
jgi:hypothetical protein